MVLRQLEYLDALVREGHFGRAAEACHVSQPALSTGLQRLEAELGLTLIRRGHRFDGLTPDGEALLRWARSALASIDGLAAEASRLRGSLSGQLRLAMIPSVAARAGDLLAPFIAEHAGVQVRLSTAPFGEILAGIERHDLDGGFLYLSDDVPAHFNALQLYRDDLVLLTTRPGWDVPEGPVSWMRAATMPLALLEPAMQNRQLIDRAFRAAGVEPEVQIEADSVEALVDLGCSGGACIVAHAWIRDRRLPPGARVHPLEDPEVAPVVGLVTRAGPLAPPIARLLRQELAMPLSSR